MFTFTIKPQLLFGLVVGVVVSLVTFGSFEYIMGDMRKTETPYLLRAVSQHYDKENCVVVVPCNNSVEQAPSSSGNSSQDQIRSTSSITVEKHDSRDFMKGMEVIQNERHQMLKSACNRYRPKLHMDLDLPNSNSLYNRNYSFTICRIFKVASSSWLRAVMVSDGFFTKKDLAEEKIKGQGVINLAYGQRSISSLNSTSKQKEVWGRSTNIITVRDPLSRIVSAYVDKMKRKPSKYYERLARYVELMYRRYRKGTKTKSKRHWTWSNYTGVPTFEDFINFLLDKNSRYKTDHHWCDYDHFCHPCEHQYDLIMKLETLQQDISYLHKKLNVAPEDYSLIIPTQPAGNRRAAFKGGNTSVSEYFEKLPLRLRKGIYEKYRFDFDAFGYDPP